MKRTDNEWPQYLILPDRVYRLLISPAENGERAFHRGLVDFRVEGYDSLSPSDSWRTLLGMSEELAADYPSFRIPIPLEWLLCRFLCHHVRTNSVHVLKGPGGEVLTTSSFKDYLGGSVTDEQAQEVLRMVLVSWVRVLPADAVQLSDLYVSTDIPMDALKRAINSLKFQEHIEELDEKTYRVKPSILTGIKSTGSSVALDRKNNRYYQEIAIQAVEPFCFVIMPFREKEFPQKIYSEVIKPFIESEFEISCYRVDEDMLPDRIDNKIYTYILRAAFIVAEVTTLNPNVMYELGLAHMLEKDCIILTKKSYSEVPFDINRISAKPYINEDELRAYLRKSISALAFKIKQ